jgi:heat shock protein HslJ
MTRAASSLAALLIGVSLAGCASTNPLEGTHWQLVAWSLSSVAPAEFAIDAHFADGRMSGRSAVNQYSGPYQLGRGDAFTAGPFASTRMAGPEPAMRAEAGYLSLLGQAKTYRFADRRLKLFDAGGNQILSFAKAAGSAGS